MNLFDQNQKAGSTIKINLSQSVSIVFIWCQSGNFQMGTTNDSKYTNLYESPPISVELTKGFWTSETPLTRQQAQALGDTKKSDYEMTEDSPATQYTWQESVIICEKLTQAIQQTSDLGLFDKHYQISLPTEAQWEYACRAGTTSIWFFGDNETELEKYGSYFQGSSLLPAVKQKLPNAWGLYDLYGMVYEWCLDIAILYKDWNNTIDPCMDLDHPIEKAYREKIPVKSQIVTRVARGGSRHDYPDKCRSSSREALDEDNSDNDLTGIRPVINQVKV